jgi:antitoxin (DNA-binding transcriptional repressor) of toxin-antitoxin stability system
MASVTFETEIVDMGPAVAVELTDELLDALGGKRVLVTVTINGYTFRTTTATMGGRRLVGLNKANKTAAGVEAGERVTVTVANDTSPRVVEVPPDLAKALKRSKSASATWGGLAYTHQREYAEWITGAKRDETRQRRVAQAIERLQSGTKTPKG